MPSYVDLRSNGHPLKKLEEYQVSDVYNSDVSGYSGSTNYYGFINSVGHWIILQEIAASGTYRYSSGQSSYSTNWTNRASLTYGYYNVAVA